MGIVFGSAAPSVRRSRLLIVAAVLVGLTIGIGGYTFVYAKGYSYLSNDPQACANCCEQAGSTRRSPAPLSKRIGTGGAWRGAA